MTVSFDDPQGLLENVNWATEFWGFPYPSYSTLPNLNSIIGNTSALESGLEGFNRQLFTGVSFSIAIVASNGLGLAIGGDRLTVSDNAYLAIYILSTLAALEHPLEALEAR